MKDGFKQPSICCANAGAWPSGKVRPGFVTTDVEEDKDNVLVRSNGDPTYFAADIAYHAYKLERGYTSLINVWGADHHGHAPRVKSVAGSPRARPGTAYNSPLSARAGNAWR